MPRVSVVICTYGRTEHARRAVASVLETTYPNFELIVVEQGREGTEPDTLAEFRHDPRLTHRRLATVGKSVALNVGLELAAGEIIALTDDDCVVSPDWIDQIVAAFRRNPSAQLIFGSVLPPDGVDADEFVPSYVPSRPVHWTGAGTHLELLGMGANLSFRRVLLERIGPFDELVGPGARFRSGDDRDFALRALAANQVIMCHPGPKVVHAGGVRSREQAPMIWYRSGFGFGARSAKALKCGLWVEAVELPRWIVTSLVKTLCAIPRRQRPTGLRRLRYNVSGCIQGLGAGLLWPVDRERGLFMLAPRQLERALHAETGTARRAARVSAA